MAAAAIGWHGPLIDLSKASSHVGDYVQLVVYVHKSTPVQYKLSRNLGGGGEVIRMDVQVGDDTRPYFPVSIWQKRLGSTIVAGDIVLLQNMKIVRFRDVTEARTVQFTFLQSLIPSKKLLASEGADELMRICRLGTVVKDKLCKVIEWARRAGLAHSNTELNNYQNSRQMFINWKMHEDMQPRECLSLGQLQYLPDASKATIYASVGEIFLPITWRHLPESESEKMFISRRISMLGDDSFADDFISLGCQLCGTPLSSEFGSIIKQNNFQLCQKSYNGPHVVSMIYRPFMLYMWDDSDCIPLLVTNKAAEMLFGNITAEKVHSCYERQKLRQNYVCKDNQSCERISPNSHDVKYRLVNSQSSSKDMSRILQVDQVDKGANYFLIWLVLLKLLLKQGENSPLKLNITVNSSKDNESGRYEMLSISMPSSGHKGAYL